MLAPGNLAYMSIHGSYCYMWDRFSSDAAVLCRVYSRDVVLVISILEDTFDEQFAFAVVNGVFGYMRASLLTTLA